MGVLRGRPFLQLGIRRTAVLRDESNLPREQEQQLRERGKGIDSVFEVGARAVEALYAEL